MSIKLHHEAVAFVPEKPALSEKQFFLRYTIATLSFIVFFVLLAFASSNIKTFSEDIKWQSTFLPDISKLYGSFENLSSEESFSVVDLGMSPDFPYIGSLRQQPTANVPSDLEVVVIGRLDITDKTSYVLANSTGSFNQTCIIQQGGEVTGMIHDNTTVFLSYTPPTGGKTGIGSCYGNEMFFMPWNH